VAVSGLRGLNHGRWSSAIPSCRLCFRVDRQEADCLDRIQIALLAATARRDAQPPLWANSSQRLIGRFAVFDYGVVTLDRPTNLYLLPIYWPFWSILTINTPATLLLSQKVTWRQRDGLSSCLISAGGYDGRIPSFA
jgi:hypothetical protein